MISPKVSIIISTLNQEKLLEKCLMSLKKKTEYPNYRVFLIDDSGRGEIGKNIKKKFRWVNVIFNKENLGFSKSNNLGIKKAIGDYNPEYILLLNDDTEITEKNWLEEIINVGGSDERVGIIGCKVVHPDGRIQWFKKYRDNIGVKEVPDVIGACFMIKRGVIEKIGFLDEGFSPAYGEETDFCFRATKKGFKLMYTGKTSIIHYGGSSTKNVFREKIWFLRKRNAIRLEWLNFSFYKIIIYSFIHLGSAVFSKNPIKKLTLLIKAYSENIKNFKEIKEKRRERQ